MPRLYFTSWHISDLPSEGRLALKAEGCSGTRCSLFAVLCDSSGSQRYSCFHVARSLLRSSLEMINSSRARHSSFGWASYGMSQNVISRSTGLWGSVGMLFLTSVVGAMTPSLNGRVGNKLVPLTRLRGIISSLTLQPYGWWAYQVLLSSPSWHCWGFCQICCCWAEYRRMDSPCPFCSINDLDNEAFTPSNGAFSLRVMGGGLNKSTALDWSSVLQQHGLQ